MPDFLNKLVELKQSLSKKLRFLFLILALALIVYHKVTFMMDKVSYPMEKMLIEVIVFVITTREFEMKKCLCSIKIVIKFLNMLSGVASGVRFVDFYSN